MKIEEYISKDGFKFKDEKIYFNGEKIFENKDLTPIMVIFFENQLSHFQGKKTRIEEKIEEINMYDFLKY